MSKATLQQLRACLAEGQLEAVDYYFAEYIAGHDDHPDVVLAAVLVSSALGQQHSCLELAAGYAASAAAALGFELPASADWRATLEQSGTVGEPGAATPLILDADRVYLARYHACELAIAAALRERTEPIAVDRPWLQRRLSHYFAGDEQVDWQKLSAALALSRRLALITGGPGTGKTSTVVKILALILEQQGEAREHFHIRMAAPTGKAAARLSQSVSVATRDAEVIDPQLAALIPSEVSTIHRLLRPLPNSTAFRHNADNPLSCDLLLLDEVSMIDIGLMASLLAALKPGARIILLGDREQLPSVGVGQLLRDLSAPLDAGGSQPTLSYSEQQVDYLEAVCGFTLAGWLAPQPGGALADCMALLRHSYRFDSGSGIGRLADCVVQGDVEALQAFVAEVDGSAWGDVELWPAPTEAGSSIEALLEPYLALQPLFARGDVGELEKLRALEQYQVLCAVRDGEAGVHRFNRAVMDSLQAAHLVDTSHDYYPGRPIMITQNSYSLRLYNGDAGVILLDESGQPYACFEGEAGAPRRVAISRLPAHESSYAITVHKSQGSEYRHVALLLPGVDGADIVTRELVYTAITRARDKLTLACSAGALTSAMARRVQRYSGLAARLHS